MDNKGKHLTEDNRYEIDHGLKKGLSFKAIAKIIDKDPSTISKEVRAHIVYEKKASYGRGFNDCMLYPIFLYALRRFRYMLSK